MKKIISCFLFAMICAILCSCSRPDSELTLKKAAISSFYSKVINANMMNVPDKKAIEALSQYISHDFYSLLVKAREAEETYAVRSVEPVPPLIEGALFVSLIEGADSCDSITPEGGNGISFIVEFTSRDNAAGTDSFRWKDRVFVVRENNRWVVDDIELLGTWSFGRKGRVKDILRDVIRIADRKAR